MADKIEKETKEQKPSSVWSLSKSEFDKLPKEPPTGKWALENSYTDQMLPDSHWDAIIDAKHQQKKSKSR